MEFGAVGGFNGLVEEALRIESVRDPTAGNTDLTTQGR
jgi:hypothetical protein